MAKDNGMPPLPRRVPGSTDSPRPPRIGQPVLPESVRRRLLAAIASEHERAEAEEPAAARDEAASQEETASRAEPAAPGQAASGIEAGSQQQAASREQAAAQAETRPASGDETASENGTVPAEMATVPKPTASPEQLARLPQGAPTSDGTPRPPLDELTEAAPSAPPWFWSASDVPTEPFPRIAGHTNGVTTSGPDATEIARSDGLGPEPAQRGAAAAATSRRVAGQELSRTGQQAGRPGQQAGKARRRPGRRYRLAGVLISVGIAVAAGSVAWALYGHNPTAAKVRTSGRQAPEAAARNRVAAWVAGQVARTATVSCDPVMCRVLESHRIAAGRLYEIGPGTINPLHSEIIVATPAVRAQFGNLLESAYAPAVLASFSGGGLRIDVREIAPHGAAAYRAMLSADLASRKASAAELLHSSRIEVTPVARQQLSAGEADSRLVVAIAEMASVHPMYIIDFGSVAPGAGPDQPLRFADLAEASQARRNPGGSAEYVRWMLLFLHAQRAPFRPAHMETVYLAGGARALRIEFPAPSPLGLLGPHA